MYQSYVCMYMELHKKAFPKSGICYVYVMKSSPLRPVGPNAFQGEGTRQTKPVVWFLYFGLCRADSPLASFTALQLLVTSSRACSAPPRTSVCKRLGGRERPLKPGGGMEGGRKEKKAFVKNSRHGEWQVGHHGSCSSPPLLLKAFSNPLRFLQYFGHICIIRKHFSSFVLRVLFYLGGHFLQS